MTTGYKYNCAIHMRNDAVRKYLISLGYEEENSHTSGEWYMTVHRMNQETGGYIYSAFVPLSDKDIESMKRVFMINEDYINCEDDLDLFKDMVNCTCDYMTKHDKFMINVDNLIKKQCKGIVGVCGNGLCTKNCDEYIKISKQF